MKKLVMMVLAIAMLALPVMASAAAVTVTTFDALKTNLEDGNDVVLNETLNDVTGDNNIVISGNKSVTVSGSGTINANVMDLFTVNNGATLTLKGITVNNQNSILWADGGTIIVDGATLTTNGGTYNAAFAANNGTIEVRSGSLRGTNGDRVTLSLKSGAKAIVSGGTVYSQASSAIATQEQNTSIKITGNGNVKTDSTNARHAAVYALYSATITMDGGEVSANAGQGIYTNEKSSATISGGVVTSAKREAVAAEKAKGASIVVTGGTFSDNSADQYLVPGLMVEKQNGKWVVKPISTAIADLPQTGDKENMMLWVALLAMSVVGLTAMRRTRRA